MSSQCGYDLLDFVGADDGVDFRHLALDLIAIALDQASRHDQLFCPADLLVLGHFEDGVDRFFFGRIDEAAGVDDEHVGLIGMWRELVPAGHKLPHHDFAVNQILGTAQADKTDFQR